MRARSFIDPETEQIVVPVDPVDVTVYSNGTVLDVLEDALTVLPMPDGEGALDSMVADKSQN